MTKEELSEKRNQAIKSLNHVEAILGLDEMYSDELEKENAELKKACDKTQELLDKQIEATYKLDKENTELRDNYEQYKAVAEPEIKSLKTENAELKKMYHELDEDNNKLRENIPLLAEAKEFLEICLSKARGNITPSWSELITDIEQFLSEVEK